MRETMQRRLHLRLRLAALACGAYAGMFSAAGALPHQVYDDADAAESDANGRTDTRPADRESRRIAEG